MIEIMPLPVDFESTLSCTAQRAFRYLEHVRERSVAPDRAAVDRLDATSVVESGSKLVADVPLEPDEDLEVVGKIGGPCRGRTYGPLIKRTNDTVARIT